MSKSRLEAFKDKDRICIKKRGASRRPGRIQAVLRSGDLIHKALLIAFIMGALMIVPQRACAIAGLEGTFEFGLDAPWRMEPSKSPNGGLEYGPIPIQITIHGAMDASLDDVMYAPYTMQPGVPLSYSVHLPKNLLSLGKFQAVRVTELGPTPRPTIEFPITSLYEIERTNGAWPWPQGQAPKHELARIWAGDNPEPLRDVSQSSEWHATLWFNPGNRTPGQSVALRIEVVLKRDPWDAVVIHPRLGADQPVPIDTSPTLTLRNYVRVYLAKEPLPRFDRRWLYGDFHYHSQGTDNEGEAGYNYRGVVRAMGAMGLDFLFATDHASASEQIIDADLPPLSKIPEIADSQGGHLKESNAKWTGGVARDMNASRFAFAHELIYGEKGVNREAAVRGPNAQVSRSSARTPQNYRSHGVMPQIYLGGEIDAVPEAKASTIRANTTLSGLGHSKVLLPYGDGMKLDVSQLCKSAGCDDPAQQILVNGGDDSVMFADFQGLDSFAYYGREHLVYFPGSSALNIGNESTFIASNTSQYGGATRRLDSAFHPTGIQTPPLLPEIERKGVAFVAHHLNSGGGPGPDGVPWTTDHMLLKAFRSSAILGLEFWNEDVHYSSRVCSHEFCEGQGDGSLYEAHEYGYERNETLVPDSNNPLKAFAIFVISGLGVDLLPSEFHNIALPLEDVRRGFISGGAKGGLFELNPFDVVRGRWQTLEVNSLIQMLYQGAYDWDMMNLRGLDFELNAQLAWLTPGEPRRMFMGGGSDAHGDLNYRRAGYFFGTEDATDNAIGKPRNLVFAGDPAGEVLVHERSQNVISPSDIGAPNPSSGTGSGSAGTGHSHSSHFPPVAAPPDHPVATTGTSAGTFVDPPQDDGPNGRDVRAYSQEQMIDALRKGHFSVTDGPAIRIAIDRNGNNVIDDDDVQMGDVLHLQGRLPATTSEVTLLTEIISNAEFGPIQAVDVYVGAHPEGGATSTSLTPRVYAPVQHGPSRFVGSDIPVMSYQSQGRTYSQWSNNYWNGELGDRVSWRASQGAPVYKMVLVTKLHLDLYEVGAGVKSNRFFVRSFVNTGRYGFSNPIWIVRKHGLPVAPQ